MRLAPPAASLAGAAAGAAALAGGGGGGEGLAKLSKASQRALGALAGRIWEEVDGRGLELARRLGELEVAWEMRARRGELPAPEELGSLWELEAASRPVLNFPRSLAVGETQAVAGGGEGPAAAVPEAVVSAVLRRALDDCGAEPSREVVAKGRIPSSQEPLERLRGCNRTLHLCLASCSQSDLDHTQWLRVLTDFAALKGRTKVWSEHFSARAPRARLSGAAAALPTVGETLLSFGQQRALALLAGLPPGSPLITLCVQEHAAVAHVDSVLLPLARALYLAVASEIARTQLPRSLLLRLWSPQQGEFLGVGGGSRAAAAESEAEVGREKEEGEVEVQKDRVLLRQHMADLAAAWRQTGTKKFRPGRQASGTAQGNGWPEGNGWPRPCTVHAGAKVAVDLLEFLTQAGALGRHSTLAVGSPVAVQAVEMLMNDASSALYSEALGLEAPCVYLSDLLAVQAALKKLVNVLREGHVEGQGRQTEAASQLPMPEGMEPVKIVWEEGAAPRKLHALEEHIGRLVAQLADFVGEEVRTQIRQAALLARRARPPQNEAEQVLLRILEPILESTGGLHSQLVDAVFFQALRGAACCCRTDQDARRVRDFVQDLQQQTSRTDKQISSMIFGLGLPAV